MKPVTLTFSGLNSYRSSQSIDFRELGKSGLFGVFGPTGSGKSTILDAISLALFGVVDRSSRNIRGIVNQQEESCQVSFAFELGGTGYKVERRYDRVPGEGDSVRARYGRLVEDDGNVLADTPRETTERVEALLGLTQTEFSRAVVLPQGKFDAFLRLTGNERAQMLERIFDLERFGERLRQRAAARRDSMQGKVNEVLAAQSVLGDCSDEAVKSASNDLDGKQNLLEEAGTRLNEIAKTFAEQSELKALFDEAGNARVKKAGLEEASEAIAEQKTRLDLARKAEPLRGLIGQVRDGENLERQLLLRLKQEQSALCTCEGDFGKTHERLLAAERRRDEEEPRLLEKTAQLDEAIRLSEEVIQGSDKLAGLRVKMKGFETQISDMTSEESVLRGTEKDIDTEIGKIDSLQESLRVSAEERQLTEAAVAAASSLTSAGKELREAETLLELKKKQTQDRRSKVDGLFGLIGQVSASRFKFDRFGELVECRYPDNARPENTSLDEYQEVSDAEVDLAENLVNRAAALYREAVVLDQAALLAGELVDGEPCPVCGSVHHPCPAADEALSTQAAERAEVTAKECLTGVRLWREDLLAAMTELKAVEKSQVEAEQAISSPGGRADTYNCLLKAFREAAASAIGEDSRRDDAALLVEGRRTSIAVKDQAMADAAGKMQDLQKLRMKTAHDLEAISQEINRLNAVMAGFEASAKAASDQAQKDLARLKEIVGEKDPVTLLAGVRGELQEIRTELQEAKDSERKIGERRDTLRMEVERISSQTAQVSSALGEARKTLAAGLGAAGFASSGEAEGAMLSAADMEAIENNWRKHRDETLKVDTELSRLQARIAGRDFSPDEFETVKGALEDVRARQGALNEEVILARRNLLDLKQKRGKWDKFEKLRVESKKARDIADTLVKLVQGRRLVQFLAQEHLRLMASEASARLGSLTGQRYALEMGEGGEFVIRDDFHGGERRGVSTLSGGETFLASLSLALALSSNLQLRGQYPLGFFFLDEGFGTLDDERLDLVMGALERVRDAERMVGIISHRQELRDRLPSYLEVLPPGNDGSGSRVVPRGGI